MKKLVTVFILFLILTNCNSPESTGVNTQNVSGDLIIFHAGSLSVPLKEIADSFKIHYPDVNILLESAGSLACARKITDLKKDCDIIAVADYKVIDNMLIPDHTSWNIKFVSNEMAIVYTKKSKYSNEINQNNWFDILLRDDVIYGRADPNSDPCGYRAILTMKLSEIYYKQKNLTSRFLNKDNDIIRPKEVDLLALLETQNVDYIFLYRSVAQQHNLEYLVLPDSINLKTSEFADFYSEVSIEVADNEPTKTITMFGEPMIYGISILNNAPNKKVAEIFIDFMLSKETGMKIFEKNGQPSVVPSKSDFFDSIPEILKKYSSK
jgi:molybdate/tungstate transport system substrate-binding protein